MSRIGRKPLPLPKGVTFTQTGGTVRREGPQGRAEEAAARRGHHQGRAPTSSTWSGPTTRRDNRAKHGLMRAHLANMVKGVTDGWTRELEINGVGYRAEVKGETITLQLGYSHPVVFKLPEGVAAKVDKNKVILDRHRPGRRSGQTAAKIRELRPPEPYKGKGVKYAEEVIRRKAGKAGATGGGGGK